MKIGIFGCSYADENSSRLPEINDNGRSWSSVLRDRNYNITNYGASGSSVYYSYNLFKQYSQLYDKIIFVVTSAQRITIRDPKEEKNFLYLTSWSTITEQISQYMKKIGVYEAVKLYFEYIYNDEEANDYRDLIINFLSSQPNILVLDIKDLLKISRKDYDFYKKLLNEDIHNMHKFIDNRYNHINNENNIILANLIEEWIESGNFNFSFDKFVNPKLDDYKKYFIKI